MNIVLKPSLEHIALAKIGILLWNQNDIRTLISKLTYTEQLYLYELMTIEEKVIDKVPQLSLPQLLKEKVFGVIKPIGMQIFEWMQYYRKYDLWEQFESHLDLPAPLPAELCWIPQGTIDRKRTAEVLVKNKNLNVFRRYCLACDYFLEDDVIRLWSELPEDVKYYRWQNSSVVSVWSYHMKRERVDHISYKDVLYSSVSDSNKIAAKYFLQKLTIQEKKECLENLTLYVEDADVLCFLLPEMEEEYQIKVLKKIPHAVLQCFLQWPWQSFFIEVADCMRNFLSKNNYNKVLRDIIRKIREGYKDYDYQKLFGNFWQKSPSALKDSFMEEIDKSWLTLLIYFKDKESIQLTFKDATLTTKANLIYSDEIYFYLTLSIHENEWDFLDFFFRECLPSKSEMLKFKEEFEKCIYFKECSETEKHKWNQLFSFSDDPICEYDKRSTENGESSSFE